MAKVAGLLEGGGGRPSGAAAAAGSDKAARPAFALRGVWANQQRSVAEGSGKPAQELTRLQTGGIALPEGEVRERVEAHSGLYRHLVVHPNNKVRLGWDFLGGFLILYDMLSIPVQVFDPPDTEFSRFMDWATLVFWTLNVYATLTVGFSKNGVTIMTPRAIFMNYTKSWMTVDMIVLLPDWGFILYNLASRAPQGKASSIRLLRMLRLARTIRLLRLFKLKWILQLVDDLLDSEFASIIANIIKMIMLLLVVNHFIACGWWLVSKSGENGDNTWIKVHHYDQVNWEYQYLTSFHWSMTQFTPSSMHVQPQNFAERFYALAVVVFALVGFSYVVGSITGSLTQLRAMKEEADKQFWQLRRYLRKNQVPLLLSLRIKRYLEHAWQQQARASSHMRVTILSMLSEQLQNELQSAITVPHLAIHPLFHYINKVSAITMQRLASSAISRVAVASNDHIFLAGEKATHVYFMSTGRLVYIKDQSGQRGQEEKKEHVEAGEDWVAEPVLWVKSWMHLGLAVASTHTELLRIDPTAFAENVARNPVMMKLARLYASQFVTWLNSQERTQSQSDIMQGEDVCTTLAQFVEEGLAEEAKTWASERRRGTQTFGSSRSFGP